MFATPTNTTSAARAMRLAALVFSTVLTAMTAMAAPAGAVEGPGDLLPGGDGPDEPEPPVIVPGFIIPLNPTATICLLYTSPSPRDA